MFPVVRKWELCLAPLASDHSVPELIRFLQCHSSPGVLRKLCVSCSKFTFFCGSGLGSREEEVGKGERCVFGRIFEGNWSRISGFLRCEWRCRGKAVGMGSDGMDIGFLGLGIMGIAMARNLLKKGFKVTVWNRSPAKCEELAKEGALIGSSPADVVKKCPITIAMLADPSVALSVALGPGGVVEGITPGKGYVDMSTVDSATSVKIAEAVAAKGGDFLEAPVSGSKQPAEMATLIILSAGNKSLFEKVKPAFDAMGKKSFYLNDVGGGAKMKLVVNMIMGSMMAAFSEGLAVADKAGLSQQTLLEVLELGSIGNPMFKMKGPSMIDGKYTTAFPLKHQQKDMRLALALGDEVAQSMPVAAAANEIYKKARSLGLGEQDFSAVHHALAQEAANVPDSAKAPA